MLKTARIGSVKTAVRNGRYPSSGNYYDGSPWDTDSFNLMHYSVHAGRIYWLGAITPLYAEHPDIEDPTNTYDHSADLHVDEAPQTVLMAPGTIPLALRPSAPVPFTAVQVFNSGQRFSDVETEIRPDGSWVITAQGTPAFGEIWGGTVELWLWGANYELAAEPDEITWEIFPDEALVDYDSTPRSFGSSPSLVIPSGRGWTLDPDDPLSFAKHAAFVHVKGKIAMDNPYAPTDKSLNWYQASGYLSSPEFAVDSFGYFPLSKRSLGASLAKWAPRAIEGPSYEGGNMGVVGVDNEGRRWPIYIAFDSYYGLLIYMPLRRTVPRFFASHRASAADIDTAPQWGGGYSPIAIEDGGGAADLPGFGAGDKEFRKVYAGDSLIPELIYNGRSGGGFPTESQQVHDEGEYVYCRWRIEVGFVGELGFICRAGQETNEGGFRQAYYAFTVRVRADGAINHVVRRYDSNQLLTPTTDYLVGDEGIIQQSGFFLQTRYDGSALRPGDHINPYITAWLKSFQVRVASDPPLYNWWNNIRSDINSGFYGSIWTQISQDGPEDAPLLAANGQTGPMRVEDAESNGDAKLVEFFTGELPVYDAPWGLDEWLRIDGAYPAIVPPRAAPYTGAGGIVPG